MNPLAAWAPTIITVLTVIFGAGKIYGRIGGQEITLKRHDDQFKQHDTKIEEHGDRLDGHDIELAKAAAWREGYNFGKKDHGVRS